MGGKNTYMRQGLTGLRSLGLLLLLLAPAMGLAQKSFSLRSPDGVLRCEVEAPPALRFAIYYRDSLLLSPSDIGMRFSDERLNTASLALTGSRTRSVADTLLPPVPQKRSRIPDVYNELTLTFKKGMSLQFRAYNDGIAYRFLADGPDSLVVTGETAAYRPANQRGTMIFPAVAKRDNADLFHTSFEEPYQVMPLGQVPAEALMFSPVLLQVRDNLNLVITESDLVDYPGMFLRAEQGVIGGVFAGYPLSERLAEGEFPQKIVTERAPCLAKTRGKRSFPWRVFLIGTDQLLPASDLVYRLASPSPLQDDWSWVRPGQGTDEWITNIALFNVPFKAGINTETYLYYIDFAKRFGLERIMLDAGWSDVKDLFKINPALDMEKIAGYAREQGIKLSMWTLAHTLDRQLEPALDQFSRWGVDFIMTDFIDRDDQPMVNFHHRVAEACARKQIMCMFHGSFKPAGFERTWPNAITREGVLGSEYNAWSEKATPEHNVLTAFIRMTSGPLDYEPGLLDNANKGTFRPIWGKVMSQGTRCHQLAMFAVYDSPIQIFSGNPSTGFQEPAFMELLGRVPTSWDETLIPAARLGDYLVSARRKGSDWVIASLNDDTARTVSFSLGFLPPGQTFEATLCKDGLNADRYASDYVLEKLTVTRETTLEIPLAAGGGFLMYVKGR